MIKRLKFHDIFLYITAIKYSILEMISFFKVKKKCGIIEETNDFDYALTHVTKIISFYVLILII